MRALPWKRFVKAVLTAPEGLISNPGFVETALMAVTLTAAGDSLRPFRKCPNVWTVAALARLTARIPNAACRRRENPKRLGFWRTSRAAVFAQKAKFGAQNF